MTLTPADSQDSFPLDDEHRMLLQIRDTLYEGSWADFAEDLRAKAVNAPHVFDTVPSSPAMKATIEHHLALIEGMSAWECAHDTVLRSDGAP